MKRVHALIVLFSGILTLFNPGRLMANLGGGITAMQKSAVPGISVEELSTRIDTVKNIVILDVRTPSEFTGPLGHIDGALLIPVQNLSARVNELQEFKDQEIHVICRSGNRSARASKFLIGNGYHATNILGGMKAWNAHLASKSE